GSSATEANFRFCARQRPQVSNRFRVARFHWLIENGLKESYSLGVPSQSDQTRTIPQMPKKQSNSVAKLALARSLTFR
ncbi:MAG: hypothetical protein ACRD3W_08140, partial [Terriglobales bacterium]